MEKRLPLAIALSFLILFGWQFLFSPPPPPAEPESAPGADPQPADVAAPREVQDFPEETLAATEETTTDPIVVGRPGEPGHFEVRWSNRGGALHSLRLGGFYTRVGLDESQRADPENWLPLVESVETREGPTGSLLLEPGPSGRELAPRGLRDVLWTYRPLEGGGAEFTYGPGTGLVFVKRITFEPGTWRVHLALEIRNEGLEGAPTSAGFSLSPAACVPPELGDGFFPEPRVVAVGREGDEARFQAAPGLDPGESDELLADQIAVGGVANKYFAFLLREEARQATLKGARWRAVTEVPATGEERRPLIEALLPVSLSIPPVGQRTTFEYTVFAGPKEPDVFEAEDPVYHRLVLDSDLGSSFCGLDFSSIGAGLLVVLRWIHAVVPNWGFAIILLTFAVRVVLFPINRRSQTAMARYQKKMKRVQPRLDEIKKRFENDPQKQREAQAKIMQEEGAFPPLGGCLPMFLQLPVFFGLFSMLRTSFDLRQEPFALWIDDLSRPDRLVQIDLQVPFLGTIEYFNLLPILMVIMWILQQRGMPQPTDEQAARMQKMMTFMPIVFGVFLYNYAAGLSLYMLTTSTLGIFEQKVIKKVWPIDDTEVVKKKASGCGPFSGFMERLAEQQKEQMKRIEAQQAERRRQQAKRKKRR